MCFSAWNSLDNLRICKHGTLYSCAGVLCDGVYHCSVRVWRDAFIKQQVVSTFK